MLPAVSSIWTRFKGSIAAFAAVWRNPNLRWLELAWTASIVGQYAFLVAVSVYAYGVGGEKAVGLIFLARLIPAALLAPFAGLLGDRYPRERVLLVTNVTRVVLVGAAALAVFADADPWVVYGFSIAATIATTPFRSSQAALTPNLARTPEELTAANAVASRCGERRGVRRPGAGRSALRRREHGPRVHHHGASRRHLGPLPPAHPTRAQRGTPTGARGVDDHGRTARRVHDAPPGSPSALDDGAPDGADCGLRCGPGLHRRHRVRAARSRRRRRRLPERGDRDRSVRRCGRCALADRCPDA